MEKKKEVSWGIIGCGDVTEKKSGPAFYKLPGSRLEAVMRRDRERAADYARRHHVPKFYDDASALIADPDVTAIYVATPPRNHCEYAIESMLAGKPVYVEKPMGLDYDECRRMLEVSEKTGVQLHVAYYRRSMPYFRKVAELLELGTVGSLSGICLEFIVPPRPEDLDRGHLPWRLHRDVSGGGYLQDMGSHQINILQYLFGKITGIRSVAQNRAGLYDAEDYVAAIFSFESGVTATCLWNFAAGPQEHRDRVEIFGTKGTIRFSVFDMDRIEVAVETGTDTIVIPREEHVQMPHIAHINEAILENRYDPAWTLEAVETTRIIDQILHTNETY